MFNRQIVEQAIAREARHVVQTTRRYEDYLVQMWHACAHDAHLGDRLDTLQPEVGIRWSGAIGTTYPVSSPCTDSHTVYAVDGSQIYPDPHMAVPAYVLHIAHIEIACGEGAYAQFTTTPYVSLAHEHIPASRVDMHRTVYELAHLARSPSHAYALIDGPLLLWSLHNTPHMEHAIAYMHQLYTYNIPCAGYMSMPQFRHLTKAIQAISETKAYAHVLDETPPAIPDVQLMQRVLPVWHRTQMFRIHDTVTQIYPEHLTPYMCYLHTGDEVVRVEMPQYMVHDGDRVERYMSVLRAHIEKGHGYPAALTEAHEAAVVRESDRQFFFTMLAEYTDTPYTSRKQRVKHQPVM